MHKYRRVLLICALAVAIHSQVCLANDEQPKGLFGNLASWITGASAGEHRIRSLISGN